MKIRNTNMTLNYILPILIFLLSFGIVQAADNTLLPSDVNLTDGDTGISSSDEPDYDAVFPNDTVQRIDIVLSSDDWQTMLTNMTELYGEFGTETRMPMGGNFTPGDPGAAPDGKNMPGERGMNLDTNPVYVPATVTLNGTTLDDVGIRFKGFSSLSGSWREGTYKISLKLDCDHYEDEDPALKNQNLYGFDELSLQSGFGDDSLIKDKVVAEIFRSAGVPAPRTAFYQVYIDTGDGPQYFGLYTLIEGVSDTMLSSQFSDGSGNLYKPQGERSATFEAGTFNTSIFEKETNKKANDYSDLEHLYAALNSDIRISDPASWRAGLEAVLDVDEFITWLATNTVIQNWDTYGSMAHNFYLYTNPETGLITWIPWDNNFALQNNSGMGGMGGMGGGAPPGFGNATGGNTTMGLPGIMQMPPGFGNASGGNISSGFPGPGQMDGGMNMTHRGPGGSQNLNLTDVGEEWPLIRYLMDDPVYYEQYVDAVNTVITDSFDPEKMKAIYTKNHDLISPYVVGSGGEQPGYTHLKDSEDFTDSLEKLIVHVHSRYDAVMAFLAEEREGGVQ